MIRVPPIPQRRPSPPLWALVCLSISLWFARRAMTG